MKTFADPAGVTQLPFTLLYMYWKYPELLNSSLGCADELEAKATL